ncbi:MAG: TIGR00730 family Rossman fold protein [Acidimicrobiia bacterium]
MSAVERPARRVRQGRRLPSTSDPTLDEKLHALVEELPDADAEIAMEIIGTAIKLAREQVSRLDRKIVNAALKEMRNAFRVFAPYRSIRKVTVFGSSRAVAGDPEYELAKQFAHEIADRGWMVITGAGPGIMQAGHEGAGGEKSFGVSIRLPFEAKPNPVIAEDPKLVNFKYFFTRKLTFMKEADAFVLLPGGFGTLDEVFELLTLIQTGKSEMHPIVMLDRPGGTYWSDFEDHLRDDVLAPGYIRKEDLGLFRIVDDIGEAVREIEQFYRVFHSHRTVKGKLIFRLNIAPSDHDLKVLSQEFSDTLLSPIEIVECSAAETRDDDFVDLPRLSLNFDYEHYGRLRQLIDRLNQIVV